MFAEVILEIKQRRFILNAFYNITFSYILARFQL